jgi:hypothetical protein
MEETKTSFAIGKLGHFDSAGDAFTFSDTESGPATTILGYPARRLVDQISNMFSSLEFMSPRTLPVAGTTEDLPALPAGAKARFTEDVYAVVAEPCRGHRRVAAVAATRFNATVDRIPRESRFGQRIPPHQACRDAPRRQPAGEHGDGSQIDTHSVTVPDVDEPGPITARGRFEAVDLAAPHLGVWASSLQFSPDGVIDLDVVLAQAPDVAIAPASQAVEKRRHGRSEYGCRDCPSQRPRQAQRTV